jgi:hypothetical protein
MHSTRWRRGLAVAALVPLLTGLTGCGDDDKDVKDDEAAAAGQKCGTLPSAVAGAKLPEGFPDVEGQVLYEPSTQGKTEIVFGLIDEGDFVEVRDEYVAKLETAGWKIDGTDQESVEAEAQFSKQAPLRAGTVKVQPLCKGYVTVRYKLSR